MKIKSITKIDYNENVYNLRIKDNHNYFANDHCVSNCHELDDIISDFISIKITETMIKRYKFSNEKELVVMLRRVTTIDDYVDFLKYLEGEIVTTVDSMSSSLSNVKRTPKGDKRDLKISKLLKSKNTDVKMMQLMTDLKQLQSKVDIFLKEYKQNKNNWVLESNYNEKAKHKELSLEPIWAYDYLDKYIFSNYDMVILMSGTILDKNLFCQLNGLDVDKSVYYSIPSPFPMRNRPIFYMPIGKMSYSSKADTFQRYIPYINKILNKYSKKKGIIHTNSFELAKWVEDSVKDPRLVFHDSSNKDEALKHHFDSDDYTVIVSPSMDTGVSFDDDRARFQIIAKIPYPSLNSQKNKLRLKNNPDWYSWKTVAGILQMAGRPIRSETDYADTIIIDGSFGDIMRYSSHFLPDWIQHSIKRINIK